MGVLKRIHDKYRHSTAEGTFQLKQQIAQSAGAVEYTDCISADG